MGLEYWSGYFRLEKLSFLVEAGKKFENAWGGSRTVDSQRLRLREFQGEVMAYGILEPFSVGEAVGKFESCSRI